MIDNVTGYDIAAEVKMVRSAFAGTILVVEGDDDILFFEKFTNTDECKLLPARGKQNVLNALTLLDKEGLGGTLGIVDADFWHIMPPDKMHVKICVIDYHDLEIMIIESQSLISLLNEYGSEEKIKNFIERCNNKNIRQIIYEIAFPFGIIRFISAYEGLQLKFTELKYDHIVNKDNLEVDVSRLIRNIYETSNCHLGQDDLSTIIDKFSVEHKDIELNQLCCGDDVIAIICIGLRKLLGTQDKKIACRRIIASALRLSYDSKYLQATKLYSCVKKWETANPPYKVFNF